jgi:hypothetical protein
MTARLFAAAALAATLFAGAAHAQTFKAPLSGAAEVPPNASPGKGQAEATLDPATKTLSWTIAYEGLTGPVVAAHIHGPAEPGANAGPVVPLTTGPSPITGSAVLTDAQIADLTAGRWYVNLHTAAHPPGEVRGQLAPAP